MTMLNDPEIHVWRVDLTYSAGSIEGFMGVLAYDERERAGRFKFASDRGRFVIRRAALRHILAGVLDVDASALEFAQGPFGKPRLIKSNLRFNTSHSGDWALIAVAPNRELGIDIEQIRPFDDALAIAERYFSRKEVQRLSTILDLGNFTKAFFECWTRKEAFIKATGEGFSRPLHTFEVTFFPEANVELHIDTRTSERWTLANVDVVAGYGAALAFERIFDAPECRVIHREWDATLVNY